MLVNMKVM